MSTPINFLAFDMNRLQIDNITREVLVGLVFNLLKGTCKSCVELEYNMEECYRALTDQLEWTNLEDHLRLVDMSKPLPLQDKEGNKERMYSSSIIKAPSISVQVEKKHGYGYLKEIVIRRADQQLYKFKEGDFLDLHLNDIEDMLLLLTQSRLSNLDGDVIVHLGVALRMFTRGIVLKSRDSPVCSQDYSARLKNFKLGYNLNSDMLRREWTEKDQKCIGYVWRKIDDQLLKRRIMRSLEVLVGGRNTKMDKRLLQRTV
ncbi:hypothetical protein Tco_1043134 [Tanacetum coccineum]|uniref:Uncharacterized protein n=1 Tax=Tanacetum coccineum TaxID=301880 RepID=A0ABQ5GM43_9ASTR